MMRYSDSQYAYIRRVRSLDKWPTTKLHGELPVTHEGYYGCRIVANIYTEIATEYIHDSFHVYADSNFAMR